ncbi:nucleoside monophosphate kinase [Candidatus Gracilibacteria bacterium]|nr:nucleoside monophosphate kinase [Candidatus Gracilibacteria bacterium]
MKIILAGIQGSGKGTQGKILEKKYNFKIFDTGAHIREISKENSEIGREVKELIDAGRLVPINILEKVFKNFLDNQSSDVNIVFDGIPRNLEQKEFFDRIVDDFKVIHLKLDKKEAENRVIGRKICFSCQTTYPKTYDHKFCERCSGKIGVRVDDSDDKALQKRIDIFVNETLPVINLYKEEGKVIEIDATKDISKVSEEIEEVLGLNTLKKYKIRELESNENDIKDLNKLYEIFGKGYEVSPKNVYLINKSSRDFLLGYETDGKIVGTLSLSICLNAGQNPYGVIENFCVLDNYRGIGIGKALMQEAENISKMFDCYKIMLLSNKKHTESNSIYLKFGFENESTFGFKKYI